MPSSPDAAGLDPDALYATVWLDTSASCWTPAEYLLVRACDELHTTTTLSDELFAALRESFSEAQLIELLALAGLYRTISYVVNGTALAREADAPRFPAKRSAPPESAPGKGSAA